jgi:hydrogenase nickel incorporation protein HypA/HybF
MQSALEIVLERAAEQGASRVHRIVLRVGPLSGVVPEALEFACEAVAQGTIAEGCRLEIQSVSVVCHCPDCLSDFEPADLFLECPRCGRPGGEVRQGRELELACVEVS